ncbi:hypothetical protein FVE85_7385 [Porphyridium purpureum]|uniref:Uncharacterized protein n=1 Tax=Porphyridium purpureum TaxID=35688 RepID=A0A5J4Z9J8_PORPP|nr:hypothetical protein FVE85_7385 [Porphyridium purpureum]|eukprot:POR1146..scf295_1
MQSSSFSAPSLNVLNVAGKEELRLKSTRVTAGLIRDWFMADNAKRLNRLWEVVSGDLGRLYAMTQMQFLTFHLYYVLPISKAQHKLFQESFSRQMRRGAANAISMGTTLWALARMKSTSMDLRFWRLWQKEYITQIDKCESWRDILENFSNVVWALGELKLSRTEEFDDGIRRALIPACTEKSAQPRTLALLLFAAARGHFLNSDVLDAWYARFIEIQTRSILDGVGEVPQVRSRGAFDAVDLYQIMQAHLTVGTAMPANVQNEWEVAFSKVNHAYTFEKLISLFFAYTELDMPYTGVFVGAWGKAFCVALVSEDKITGTGPRKLVVAMAKLSANKRAFNFLENRVIWRLYEYYKEALRWLEIEHLSGFIGHYVIFYDNLMRRTVPFKNESVCNEIMSCLAHSLSLCAEHGDGSENVAHYGTAFQALGSCAWISVPDQCVEQFQACFSKWMSDPARMEMPVTPNMVESWLEGVYGLKVLKGALTPQECEQLHSLLRRCALDTWSIKSVALYVMFVADFGLEMAEETYNFCVGRLRSDIARVPVSLLVPLYDSIVSGLDRKLDEDLFVKWKVCAKSVPIKTHMELLATKYPSVADSLTEH